MKTYGEVKVQPHTFIISGTNGVISFTAQANLPMDKVLLVSTG
jgi:hypothetical protein